MHDLRFTFCVSWTRGKLNWIEVCKAGNGQSRRPNWYWWQPGEGVGIVILLLLLIIINYHVYNHFHNSATKNQKKRCIKYWNCRKQQLRIKLRPKIIWPINDHRLLHTKGTLISILMNSVKSLRLFEANQFWSLLGLLCVRVRRDVGKNQLGNHYSDNQHCVGWRGESHLHHHRSSSVRKA